MKRFTLSVAVAVALAISVGAQDYRSRIIQTLGGKKSTVQAMNRSGQVTGAADINNRFVEQPHAFLWSKTSGTQDLGTLGGNFSYGSFVNDLGQVAGASSLAGDSVYHAFRWTASSGMQDLGSFGGGGSNPYGMNAAGTVVGFSSTSSNMARAFRWTPSGGMQDLGFGDGSLAVAINDLDEVLGTACTGSCSTLHSYLWSSSHGVESLDFPGSTYTRVLAINNSEQVVGQYSTAAGIFSFLWSRSGGFQTLPSLGGNRSAASAINAVGQVGGYSCLSGSNPPCHAFLWSSTSGIQDLGAPPNLDQSGVLALNIHGEVLGAAASSRSEVFQYFDWTSGAGLKAFPYAGNRNSAPGALNDAGQIAQQRAVIGFVLTPVMHVTLTSSLNPSKKGQAVTFTATVTSVVGAPPDGELITFKMGGKPIGSVALIRGTANFTTSALTLGTHGITASYPGDVNYDHGFAGLQQVVNP